MTHCGPAALRSWLRTLHGVQLHLDGLASTFTNPQIHNDALLHVTQTFHTLTLSQGQDSMLRYAYQSPSCFAVHG